MALTKFVSKAGSLFLKPSFNLSRSFATSAVARSSKEEEPIDTANFDEFGFPDDLDISCGMYRKELIARLAGVQDPFSISAIDRAEKGTKLDPIRVPSGLESRMVACRCEPESHTLLYMWLHQNEPKRCRCGFWMVLFYREPFVEYMMPY
ncbi:cytochrome c oxidase subunit 5B, mitochondrial-like [Planococcus citri]|uniref:cytochrome c oxidase subunit 5B, mitochondrial-like n=1 Tax=Planococcus citri TaxID=170843 RepID=UPI0031F97F2D